MSTIKTKRIIRNTIEISCLLIAVLIITMLMRDKRVKKIYPKEKTDITREVSVEESDYIRLIGVWQQTQEYLDYQNEYIFSTSVTITDKDLLLFSKDGRCELTSSVKGHILFSFECSDGNVILIAQGMAPILYRIEDPYLIDPYSNVAEFERIYIQIE